MKRWAVLTVFLYAVSVSALVAPILFFLGTPDVGELLGAFFALFLPALVLIQAVLLLIPAEIARGRPVKRRTVITSAAVGALPMGILLFCFLWFILIMIQGETGSGWIEDWTVFTVVGSLWLGWGFLFYRRFSPTDPGSMTASITGWLLKGSILEILVAIPSHILSRHRHECCAPGFTLLGLATGLSVALMAFGPGVFFLFARKIQEKTRGRG